MLIPSQPFFENIDEQIKIDNQIALDIARQQNEEEKQRKKQLMTILEENSISQEDILNNDGFYTP